MGEVKVCIKLVDDSSAESKTLAETVPRGMTLEELIEKKVASVGWAGRNLVAKSAQLYDEDFKQFFDITKPFDFLVLLNMQRFEVHLNKAIVGGNSHKILFYYFYSSNGKDEGRIGLFNSFTCSAEGIAKFQNWYLAYQVATIQNKIFGISNKNKSFEIYDLNTRQISRGLDPPEWRSAASVAYVKHKLYYLGGWNPKTGKDTNRVDVLIYGKWQTGPTFPLPIGYVRAITCDGILYVIDSPKSKMIYRLSDDEREWIAFGEIPEQRGSFGVTLLNGRIYITGGKNNYDDIFKSCLCFDPSAPVGSRISRIADMNYARSLHSLVAANKKLYAIGGFRNTEKRSDDSCWPINFCDAIEEYDPQTDKWRIVGRLKFE